MIAMWMAQKLQINKRMGKCHFQNELKTIPELFMFQDCFSSLFVCLFLDRFRVGLRFGVPQPSHKLRSGLPHSVERPSILFVVLRLVMEEMDVSYKMRKPQTPNPLETTMVHRFVPW